MGFSNIKLKTKEIQELKKFTQEKTGQKAVRKALLFFLVLARQRQIIKLLETIKFHKKFNPIKLRQHER